MSVVTLATSNSNPRNPVRACATCAHRPKNLGNLSARCLATNSYIDLERVYAMSACGKEGKLWEMQPPSAPWQPGLFKRGWRYLFGGPVDT